MENGKVALEQCPKCRSLGTIEITRQWDMDRDPNQAVLVAFFQCESCNHAWTRVLEQRPKSQLEKEASQ